MAKVTFDGTNKLIMVVSGVTDISVKDDVYSEWKRWSVTGSNLRYEYAMRTVGGEPTVGTSFLGSTYFLTNDWRLKTWEGDHELILNGNIYVDGSGNIFVPTDSPWHIVISVQRSNLVDVVQVSSSFEESDRSYLKQIEQNVSRGSLG